MSGVSPLKPAPLLGILSVGDNGDTVVILLVIRRDRRVETWKPLQEGADVDASVAD
jgi:hypothetical protein